MTELKEITPRNVVCNDIKNTFAGRHIMHLCCIYAGLGGERNPKGSQCRMAHKQDGTVGCAWQQQAR